MPVSMIQFQFHFKIVGLKSVLNIHNPKIVRYVNQIYSWNMPNGPKAAHAINMLHPRAPLSFCLAPFSFSLCLTLASPLDSQPLTSQFYCVFDFSL